ncbi:hypothetical protein K443DRAFT_124215 [Laccaria amethystina LaAM-08-1]|uniref:Uncharacterized protein n=1 Tax=Laccaria amethystina LaAM-08-1 TaxID=1095629 RepID=A0A0C9XH88_9AGAR|nr:hypothetical protein K443DRAFT_124215 [Laccaria amethystina LaAM-08-1]
MSRGPTGSHLLPKIETDLLFYLLIPEDHLATADNGDAAVEPIADLLPKTETSYYEESSYAASNLSSSSLSSIGDPVDTTDNGADPDEWISARFRGDAYLILIQPCKIAKKLLISTQKLARLKESRKHDPQHLLLPFEQQVLMAIIHSQPSFMVIGIIFQAYIKFMASK